MHTKVQLNGVWRDVMETPVAGVGNGLTVDSHSASMVSGSSQSLGWISLTTRPTTMSTRTENRPMGCLQYRRLVCHVGLGLIHLNREGLVQPPQRPRWTDAGEYPIPLVCMSA